MGMEYVSGGDIFALVLSAMLLGLVQGYVGLLSEVPKCGGTSPFLVVLTHKIPHSPAQSKPNDADIWGIPDCCYKCWV